MVRCKQKLLLITLLLGSATTAESQVALPLNLATLPAENEPRPLPEGTTFVVQLRNAVPRFDYVVTPVLRRRAIAPLTFARQTGQLPRPDNLAGPPATTCKASEALNAVVGMFDTLSAESSVPKAVREANDSLTAEDAQTGCDQEAGAIRGLLEATNQTSVESVRVPRGFDLTVVVTRTSADPKVATKTWTVPYAGRDAGEWMTTYGFSFLTTWPWGETNESYVAEETDTEGEFAITRGASRERLRFVPTIFYTWHPDEPVPVLGPVLGDDFSYGLSGGLGFDLSDPVIAATFSLIYRRNLTLHLGVAAAQIDQLRERYEEGDSVGNLTPEELVESNYRINPFISLSFNFATSPFGSEEPSDDGEGGGDATGEGEGEGEQGEEDP